ncbi:hypothetical protein [Flavobacterium sp. N3904]|uniref:hypothetical protein n=1 Tax=Flavobacterium sp. N3904 TaxID=2986835 RepID=UPI0022243718|nr:hypothetical protein [Flavobacterium sp. N3904]
MTKIILCLIQFLVFTAFQFVPKESSNEGLANKNGIEIQDTKSIKKEQTKVQQPLSALKNNN